MPAHSRSSSHNEACEENSDTIADRRAEEADTADKSPLSEKEDGEADPPLPNEPIPPLPREPVPDDGWDPVWDANAQAYYFYNRFTKVSQWENPRVPETAQAGIGNHDRIGDGVEDAAGGEDKHARRPHGGYDPAIHGDYDPTAPYALEAQAAEDAEQAGGNGVAADAAAIYGQSGAFNRWTGKWQRDDVNPENHNDENKSKRQMSAFFDVDAAANSHNGRSLKAERSSKKLSKQELKAFKEKRKEKKEEKRRAWLRD